MHQTRNLISPEIFYLQTHAGRHGMRQVAFKPAANIHGNRSDSILGPWLHPVRNRRRFRVSFVKPGT